MKVKLLNAQLKTYHIKEDGVVDRRYKTGFRVLPKDYMGYEIKLLVSNPDSFFKTSDVVQTQYGNFVVISAGVLFDAITLKQCRAVESGDSFVFTPEIYINPLARFVGEGSDSLNPKIKL